MTMTTTDAWVGGALRRVTNAVAIEQLHGTQSSALKTLTSCLLYTSDAADE